VGYVTFTLGLLIPPGVLCAHVAWSGGRLAGLAWVGVVCCVGAALGVVRFGWRRTGKRYVLTVTSLFYTDVALRRTPSHESRIPLAALSEATVRQRGWQKALAIGDIWLYPYGAEEGGKPIFQMTDVPDPWEVARLIRQRLYLLSETTSADDDSEYRDILERLFRSHEARFDTSPRDPLSSGEERVLPLLGVPVLLTALTIGVLSVWEAYGNRPAPEATYAPDDPIRFPDGRKRPREEIIRFMRSEVLPFAKKTLAPVVGGEEKVTCKTCHGKDAEARRYRMPAVAALPNTEVVGAMTRRSATETDVQLQNALVGELSDPTKAACAEYMRRVVLPKMAALLRRPTYDRLRTYKYNKEHAAFGCYHCHELNKSGSSP